MAVIFQMDLTNSLNTLCCCALLISSSWKSDGYFSMHTPLNKVQCRFTHWKSSSCPANSLLLFLILLYTKRSACGGLMRTARLYMPQLGTLRLMAEEMKENEISIPGNGLFYFNLKERQQSSEYVNMHFVHLFAALMSTNSEQLQLL